MKTKIIAILAVVTIAAAQTSITYVNPGSSPDATDGDTIRNAFITCNNDFTYIGGQLSTLNNSLAGLGTTYDADGMALLVGLNVTNYVRYAVGTNTVGWLGCLNAESNVLQSDITALTNNVDALWGIIGGDGSGLVMPTVANPAPFPWGPEDAPWGPPTALVDYGSQMCFDSYKVPGQGGPGYGWTTGVRSDGFGTLSAYQFQGNLVDAAGNGNWAITDVNQDTVNTPYGGVPPVDITGFIPVSQNNGTWLWAAPSSLTFLHIAFENGAIYSYANAGVTYMVVGGSFQADQLMDSYGDTPASGMVATSVGSDGTWQWMTPPTLPSTLNFDGGSITSDGSGDATFVSIYAQQLKDSSSWTGSAGYYAQANGSGGWAWTEWPTTLSYDGGAVYSDGSGNLYATALKAELWDSGYSSGGGGQTPTANGDGTWTWQTPATAMVSGGGGTMNFDGGSITSDGGGDVTIGGTASFMGGQTVIDYGSGGVQLKINGGSGYQSGGAQIDVAGTVCLTAAGEVDVGNGGSFTDPSPGYGYDVKCGGGGGGITSIGQINANGGFLINNQTLVDGSGNVTATSVQAPQLQDSAPSSGACGQVATAQGGGTWLWQTPPPQNVFTNAHGARFGLMVNATTNGFIFVPLP